MPATLNINQIISLPLVVLKINSLPSPASVKASGGVFTLLYKTLPSIEYHLPAIPYLTTSHQIPNLPPNQSLPSQKPSCIQPTTPNKETPDFFISERKKEERERKRKKWNTTAPSTEALPVGASTCVLVGPEPIVEVMGFPIRLLRNFIIL